jgi:MraZ protein
MGLFQRRGIGGVTGKPVIYSGQGFSPKGDKDRFVLPAAFRKTVTESSEGKGLLLVSKHDKWDCLIGYGLSRREGLMAQIDREEEMAARASQPFDRDMRYFQLFDCAEISFDGSGRFIIPAHLRALGGIGDAIYYQGAGPFFTLWSPEVLARQDGPQWASAQAACASLTEGARK